MPESLASLRRERDALRRVFDFDVEVVGYAEETARELGIELRVCPVRLIEACEDLMAAGLHGVTTYETILAECPRCHVWRETGPFGANVCTCEG